MRLEPLGPKHNEPDHAAWMSSIEHIHATPGFDDGEDPWPLPMTLDENLADLEGHAADLRRAEGSPTAYSPGDRGRDRVFVHLPF